MLIRFKGKMTSMLARFVFILYISEQQQLLIKKQFTPQKLIFHHSFSSVEQTLVIAIIKVRLSHQQQFLFQFLG